MLAIIETGMKTERFIRIVFTKVSLLHRPVHGQLPARRGAGLPRGSTMLFLLCCLQTPLPSLATAFCIPVFFLEKEI